MDYLSVILFAVATCVTPGPNNVMLMSSGVNFGISRTMRHVIGINVGFPLMLIVVGWGAGALFSEYPIFHTILRVVSIGYLIHLAYGIANNPIADLNDKSGSPLGVINAAFFQWVNPKAWIMCIGAVSAYTNPSNSYYFQVVLIAFIFELIRILSHVNSHSLYLQVRLFNLPGSTNCSLYSDSFNNVFS